MRMRDDYQVELISSYIDGELMPQEQAEAERTIGEDPSRQQLCEDLQALRVQLQSLPQRKLPEDFADRVIEAALRRKAADHGAAALGRSTASSRRGWRALALAGALMAALLLIALLPFWLTLGDPVAEQGTHHVELPRLKQGPTGAGEQESNLAHREPPTAPSPSGGSDPLRQSPPQQADHRVADLQDLAMAQATPAENQQAAYLFVVDVAMTATGRDREVFETALANVGITFESTIDVDQELQASLLESRFLANVDPRPDAATDEGDVHLLYLTGTGQQIDILVTDLQMQPPHFVDYVRFDLALQPSEAELFEQLQHAATIELATTERAPSGGSRAHWLALPFALFSTSSHSLLTYEPPTLRPNVPAPPPENLVQPPPPQQPGQAIGASAQYKVLFILRH